MDKPQPPPGWYLDDQRANEERWWDGEKWTGATRAKVVATPRAEREDGARWARGLLWAVIGFVLLLFVGCMALMASGDDDGPEGLREYEARNACEEFIDRRLKSPGSSEYNHESTVEVSDGGWTVTGTVDAQNSFGALVRMTYSCTVAGTGGSATLVDLDLTE